MRTPWLMSCKILISGQKNLVSDFSLHRSQMHLYQLFCVAILMNLHVLFIFFLFQVVCLFSKRGYCRFPGTTILQETCMYMIICSPIIDKYRILCCNSYVGLFVTGWYCLTAHHSAVSSLLLCLYLIILPMDRCSLRSGVILILAAEEMSGPERPRTIQINCATCLQLVS